MQRPLLHPLTGGGERRERSSLTFELCGKGRKKSQSRGRSRFLLHNLKKGREGGKERPLSKFNERKTKLPVPDRDRGQIRKGKEKERRRETGASYLRRMRRKRAATLMKVEGGRRKRSFFVQKNRGKPSGGKGEKGGEVPRQNLRKKETQF